MFLVFRCFLHLVSDAIFVAKLPFGGGPFVVSYANIKYAGKSALKDLCTSS